MSSQYPHHEVTVASFETTPFEEQLRIIADTDILVAVHGAGNIHLLFLKTGATLVEYVPPGFDARKRFRYLAACIGVQYIKKAATIVKRFPGRIISVGLR
jgi:EGF domain-specific O-GlcNAc transferase